MWKLNRIGQEKIWYEKSLIDRIKQECQETMDTYDKEQFYEDDCGLFEGEAIMANRIMTIIQERS